MIVVAEENKTKKMKKKANTSRMSIISSEAKKIYNDGKSGMKWTDAIKKASVKLKKEGKI
jgi:hypothetical protein